MAWSWPTYSEHVNGEDLLSVNRDSPSEYVAEQNVRQAPNDGDSPVSPLSTERVAHLLNVIVPRTTRAILATGGRVAIDEITRGSREVVGCIFVTGLIRGWVEGDEVILDTIEREIAQGGGHHRAIKVSKRRQPLRSENQWLGSSNQTYWTYTEEVVEWGRKTRVEDQGPGQTIEHYETR